MRHYKLRNIRSLTCEGYVFEKMVKNSGGKYSGLIYLPRRFVGEYFTFIMIPIEYKEQVINSLSQALKNKIPRQERKNYFKNKKNEK